jgi:ribosome-binding factor A
MSRKIERLTELVQREVSHVIMYELADPRLGFVTVTEVKLAPDLSMAMVFISVMGDDAVQATTMKVIEHSRGHIQKLLADRVKMRRVPILSFRVDEGVKRSVRISALLRKLAEERGESAEPAAEGQEPANETDLTDEELAVEADDLADEEAAGDLDEDEAESSEEEEEE